MIRFFLGWYWKLAQRVRCGLGDHLRYEDWDCQVYRCFSCEKTWNWLGQEMPR